MNKLSLLKGSHLNLRGKIELLKSSGIFLEGHFGSKLYSNLLSETLFYYWVFR